MNRYSLKWRILLLFTLLLLMTQGFTFVMIRNMTQLRYNRYMERADRGQAEILAEVLARNWGRGEESWDLPAFSSHPMGPMMDGRHGRGMAPMRRDWILVDKEGALLHSSVKDIPPLSRIDLSRAVPVTVDRETVAYVLVGGMLGHPMAQADRLFLRELNRIYLISSVIFIALGLFLALLVFNRLFLPLRKIHETTSLIAAGDYSARTELTGKDEVGQLAESFDKMAQAMEEAGKWKERIIADTAHELRTPVALIRGNLEMISEGIYPASGERLGKLQREVESLSRLIEDMQTLSSMEGSDPQLNISRENPVEVLQELKDSMAPLLQEKHLLLETDFPDNCPLLEMDILRFQQIVRNLLTNAIRYSPEKGSIRISLILQDEKMRFRVDDQGPGIPEEDRERIFERFTRLEASRNRQEGGRGLGLAITRAMVRAMGGEIGAEDSPLGGAGLWFQLPLL